MEQKVQFCIKLYYEKKREAKRKGRNEGIFSLALRGCNFLLRKNQDEIYTRIFFSLLCATRRKS